MASSSSSSHLITPSVSQSWNHDVFLSFRGEDTRKSFIDHLYLALEQQGIQTYKDDETLARGESIGPSLLKAIQESQVAIVVFSKNYADSSWCLDELVCIMECMDKRGQIVMPVFYDIDPSHVRKQNEKYREAFEKHERENMHKVEAWREALSKAGNLSGWVPKDFANGHEAKCIKDIVRVISGRLSLQIANVNKDFIGMETRLLDLKSKLEIGSGGVRIVGIWGVGGGGKTTLASAAYMEISHHFEAYCLLENIRDESRKHGLKRLQETFLSLVLKINVKLGSEIEGRSMIERRLSHKCVLVVLDDVDDPEQLKALVGSHDWFGEGSRIIIMTRDGHLLSRKADMIYEVSLLSHNEAMKLFHRHAFREDEPVEDYAVLSLEVVSYAGGLPLALEILGSFLYDKDKEEWKSFLAKLKHIPDDKVTKRLKISYDGLEPGEKDLFLDIACFFKRCPIELSMSVLDTCGFHPRIGVKVLVQKSLIKVSDGKFDMHDLIEEMAHYIIRGEYHNNPGKYSRIWQEKDILELCAKEASTLTVKLENETLALSRSVWHPCLPDVVANMEKLRWITWEGYSSSSFPTNFQPTKLGFLQLSGGRQEQLWEGCKLLPNLKVLELNGLDDLIRTPNFDGLPCLETLNLRSCSKLKDIHPSIGNHERLVVMNFSLCTQLKKFPPIVRMTNLETLSLSSCNQLIKFPDIQTNMDSLVNLCFDGTCIEVIPPSVGQFCTNLVYFDLRRCSRLKRIEGTFRLLERLKVLHLSDCNQLEKLPADFKEYCLDVLSLYIKSEDSTSSKNSMNCIKLQCFRHDDLMSLKVPQFPRFLTKLVLSHCHLGDGDIPSDMSELLNLKVLFLNGNNFSRLHSSLARIPCLKFLELSDCESLVELPDLPPSIAILRALRCYSLLTIGDLSSYKWLWNVSLLDSNERALQSMLHDRALHSMLQENAVEDRLMFVTLPLSQRSTFHNTTRLTLQLPHDWHRDFSGFLLCDGTHTWDKECSIVIMQDRPMYSQPTDDHWEMFNTIPIKHDYAMVGYLPFVLFRHAPWWNFASTEISFQIRGMNNPKVGLVPKHDSRETTTDCSVSWDEDDEIPKTFTFTNSSKSSVEILWHFNDYWSYQGRAPHVSVPIFS